jgi:hypothetical protein
MKDGEIAEVGKHSELIAKNGEYAKLYNIQANAFLADVLTPLQSGHGTTPANPGTDDSEHDDYDDSYDSSE